MHSDLLEPGKKYKFRTRHLQHKFFQAALLHLTLDICPLQKIQIQIQIHTNTNTDTVQIHISEHIQNSENVIFPGGCGAIDT